MSIGDLEADKPLSEGVDKVNGPVPYISPIVRSMCITMGKTGLSDFSTTLENDLYNDFWTTYEHQIVFFFPEASSFVSTNMKKKIILNYPENSVKNKNF